MRPMEVSIQPPQEQPPPPSGMSIRPCEGSMLIQQLGRTRDHLLGVRLSNDHWVRQRLMPRKKRLSAEATTVAHPSRGPKVWSRISPSASWTPPGST